MPFSNKSIQLKLGSKITADAISGDGSLLLRKGRTIETIYQLERLSQPDVKFQQYSSFRHKNLLITRESLQAAIESAQSKPAISKEQLRSAISLKTEVVQDITTLFEGIGSNGGLDVSLVEKSVRRLVGDLNADSSALLLTTKLKNADAYTFTHSANVCILSMYITLNAGFDEYIMDVGTGALLHDVGKIVTPDEILNKRGPLDSYERSIINLHPQDGFEMITHEGYANDIVFSCVLDHHEKINGIGYPNHKASSDIGIFARITSLADIYDALTTDRPYRKGMSPIEALILMGQKMQNELDPTLFNRFVSAVCYVSQADIDQSLQYNMIDETEDDQNEDLFQTAILSPVEHKSFDFRA
jgi:HD-GYP domain-containing protein (c-di-GMP phosphodiesterase class II)